MRLLTSLTFKMHLDASKFPLVQKCNALHHGEPPAADGPVCSPPPERGQSVFRGVGKIVRQPPFPPLPAHPPPRLLPPLLSRRRLDGRRFDSGRRKRTQYIPLRMHSKRSHTTSRMASLEKQSNFTSRGSDTRLISAGGAGDASEPRSESSSYCQTAARS